MRHFKRNYKGNGKITITTKSPLLTTQLIEMNLERLIVMHLHCTFI